MIHIRLSYTLQKIISFIIMIVSVNGVLAAPATGMATMSGSSKTGKANGMANMSDTNGYIAGNILKTNGWYERYGNGQLVLYPVNNPSAMAGMEGMFGMGGMFGMEGMSGMFGMGGMSGMFGSGGALGEHHVTFGRFWITQEGHLVLYPVRGISSMDDVR
jgi:hypothetical protein